MYKKKSVDKICLIRKLFAKPFVCFINPVFGFGLFDSGDYFPGGAGHEVPLQVGNYCTHEGSSQPEEGCLNPENIRTLSLVILYVVLSTNKIDTYCTSADSP